MLQLTEESQIHSIEDALHRKFDEAASPATVHAEVMASLDAFRDARIRTFVPVLVQREAAVRLRGLPQQSVSTPSTDSDWSANQPSVPPTMSDAVGTTGEISLRPQLLTPVTNPSG